MFDGTAATAIGAQKFDREFFRELDGRRLNYIRGSPNRWLKADLLGLYRQRRAHQPLTWVLIYNWDLGRAIS